jgi:hypothetical protein
MAVVVFQLIAIDTLQQTHVLPAQSQGFSLPSMAVSFKPAYCVWR